LVEIFPNPATSHVTIRNNNFKGTPYQVSITNPSGILVHQETVFEKEHTIRLESLVPGVYFVQIEGDTSTNAVKIIVD